MLISPPQHLQECVLGLTDRSHLYAGDTEVSNHQRSSCVLPQSGLAVQQSIVLSLSSLSPPLSLSLSLSLCVSLSQLASNISSFAVCNDFLLITTHSHTCRCLQLNTLGVQGRKEAEDVTASLVISTGLPYKVSVLYKNLLQ